MRLLPYQQGVNLSRRGTAFWVGHFSPACAFVALFLCAGDGTWEETVVDRGDAAGEEGGVVPPEEGEHVPEGHFEMEFAVPAVVDEAGFLRGEGGGGVDGGEVEGGDDATLELVGDGVGGGG